ncbi:hypothetical protein JK207_08795 [Gluconobacter cerinus]|uniref:hypothetical protein n=1 Tax=Gluconobacter TaxID=441 RepID=UPI001B8B5BE4|nr:MULTISPECIES: hypothetical protein [Gluconobacter]MBS0995807.1 hypothetical protein [Gluconobacter cerinus]MBS1022123.1 hypothetical protein [Gluconobacter cerinus]
MTESGQPSLTLLFEQAQQRLDRHYLTEWLDHHHDELVAHLAGQRVNWPLWLEVFKGQHLVDRRGNPPTVHTARKAWLRVRSRRAGVNKVRSHHKDQTEALSRVNTQPRSPESLAPAPQRPLSTLRKRPSGDMTRALEILKKQDIPMPDILNPRVTRKSD